MTLLFLLVLFFGQSYQGDLETTLKGGDWKKTYDKMDLEPSFSGTNIQPGSVVNDEANVFSHFYDEYAILWGGRTFQDYNLTNVTYFSTDVWYYSYSTQKFEFVAGPKGIYDVSNGEFPNGRKHSGYAVDVINRKLYIVGGENSIGYFRDIWEFSGETKRWTKLQGNLNDVGQVDGFYDPLVWLYYKDGDESHPMLRYKVGSLRVNGGKRNWIIYTYDTKEKSFKKGRQLAETETYGNFTFPYYSRDEYLDFEGRFMTYELGSYPKRVTSFFASGYDYHDAFITWSYSIDGFALLEHTNSAGFLGASGDHQIRSTFFSMGEGGNPPTTERPVGVAYRIAASHLKGQLISMDVVVLSGVQSLDPLVENNNVYHYSIEVDRTSLELLTFYHLLYGSHPLHLLVPILTYLLLVVVYSILISSITALCILCVCFPIAPLISLPVCLLIPVFPLCPYCFWGVLSILWYVVGSSLSVLSRVISELHSTIDDLICMSLQYSILFFVLGGDHEYSRKIKRKIEKKNKEKKEKVEKLNDIKEKCLDCVVKFREKGLKFSDDLESDEFYDKLFDGSLMDGEKCVRFCVCEPFMDPSFIPKVSQCSLVANLVNSFVQFHLFFIAFFALLFCMVIVLTSKVTPEDGTEEGDDEAFTDPFLTFRSMVVMVLFTVDFFYGMFSALVSCIPCFERLLGVPEGAHFFEGAMKVNSLCETVSVFAINELILVFFFVDFEPWTSAFIVFFFRMCVVLVTCDNQFCDLYSSGFKDDSLCCFYDILHLLRLPFHMISLLSCVIQECCCCACLGILLELLVSTFLVLIDGMILFFIVFLAYRGTDRYQFGNPDVSQSELLEYKAIIFWAFFASGFVDLYFEISSELFKPAIGDEELADILPENVKEKIKDSAKFFSNVEAKKYKTKAEQETKTTADKNDDDDDDDDDEEEEGSVLISACFILLKLFRYLVGKICYLLSSPVEIISKFRIPFLTAMQATLYLEELLSEGLIPFTPYIRDYDPMVFFYYIILPVMFYCMVIFCILDIVVLIPRSSEGCYFFCRNVNTACDFVTDTLPTNSVITTMYRRRKDIKENMKKASESTNKWLKERRRDSGSGRDSSGDWGKRASTTKTTEDVELEETSSFQDPENLDNPTIEDMRNLDDFRNFDDSEEDNIIESNNIGEQPPSSLLDIETVENAGTESGSNESNQSNGSEESISDVSTSDNDFDSQLSFGWSGSEGKDNVVDEGKDSSSSSNSSFGW